MNATFQHCKANGLLGVGWRVGEFTETHDWPLYEKAARQVHHRIQQPRYIYDNVKPNDLVWTRDPNSQYYLTRVTSGWEYWTNQAGRKKDIDIANVFRCVFLDVPLDAVPGTVVSSFGYRGHTIQRIRDRRAEVYSRYLWNDRTGQRAYSVDMQEFPDIFAMLDSEETEDLVFLYLQSRGWYVVPNSRKGNTLHFEFMLAHSETGEKALTQVKSGDATLRIPDYANHAHRVFVFQSKGYYEGQADRVDRICHGELVRFLQEKIPLFPESFRRKRDLVEKRGGSSGR